MNQNPNSISFPEFELEVGFLQDQTPMNAMIDGSGQGERRDHFEDILFNTFKDFFKKGKLRRKGKIWDKYKALDGEEKPMYYEDLYFRVDKDNPQYEYAIEVDQDFHLPKWREDKQNYQYTPIYEILREAAYFELQKSFGLLRFGYNNKDRIKDEESLKLKFKLLLLTLESSSSEDLHAYLLGMRSKESDPLVVFVDYNGDNPHVRLHEKMDPKFQHVSIEVYEYFCKYFFNNSGNPSRQVYFYSEISNSHEKSDIPDPKDSKYITKFDLRIFSYNRGIAEDVAKKEQRQIIDKYLLEFNKLEITDLKRREFRELTQNFNQVKDPEN